MLRGHQIMKLNKVDTSEHSVFRCFSSSINIHVSSIINTTDLRWKPSRSLACPSFCICTLKIIYINISNVFIYCLFFNVTVDIWGFSNIKYLNCVYCNISQAGLSSYIYTLGSMADLKVVSSTLANKIYCRTLWTRNLHFLKVKSLKRILDIFKKLIDNITWWSKYQKIPFLQSIHTFLRE